MKSLLLALLVVPLVATACAAPQHHYTNVASVRSDIKATIAHDGTPREIVSMGHTTDESAVIYTQTSKDAPRVEEHWVRQPTGWTRDDAKSQAHM